MKKLFLLLASVLIFTACEITFVPSGPSGPSNPGNPNNIPSRQFWAQVCRERDNSFYTLTAQMLAEGTYCTVWGETGNNRATTAVAQSMARTYDTDIYPKMKDVFSVDNLTYEGTKYKDTMALADALGDEDGKLCILLLDIKDDFNASTYPYMVAGYFAPFDFFSNADPFLIFNNLKSNERDMIYVDINPSVPGSPESNSTLAHEMQHLMNFVNDQVLRDTATDTWLTEGLSSAAEWVYTGTPDANRLDWYNRATTANGSRITTGNNFFMWDQYKDYSNMDDYATVNLFFQWLRLQSGGNTGIYRAISGSKYSDYRAIVNAMNDYNDWGSLLKTWLAANYINAPTGRYGYMNDSVLRNVKARTVPSGTTRVNLYPGEGVYSFTNKAGSTQNPAGNIRYAGLNMSTGDVNDAAVFASGALLTYNVSTNLGGRPEAGTTTGIAASVETGRFVEAWAPSGPFRISASDILRRNGYGDYAPLRINTGVEDN